MIYLFTRCFGRLAFVFYPSDKFLAGSCQIVIEEYDTVNMLSKLDKTLSRLGFSGGAIRVYGELIRVKEASAAHIAHLAGLPRTSVYDYLKELTRAGLAVELDVDNKKIFRPDDPRNLSALLSAKLLELKEEETHLRQILPELSKHVGGSEPRVKFYSGEGGFVAVLADVLRSGVKELLFIWPVGEMTNLIGEKQMQDFTYRRARAGMHIRSIWPHFAKASRGKPNFKLALEQARVAPKNLSWQMGACIYGDKVAFISSRAERFAFVVTSHDFAKLERAHFELLWQHSKSVS